MNRSDLQQLAEDRLLDAAALLAAGRWTGAYYLAGYAVECALKSCILFRVINTGVIFDEGQKKFSERCLSHDIEELVKLAGLEQARGLDVSANPARDIKWQVVKDWKVESRYAQTTQARARELYAAVADNANGVISWLRGRW
jgi:HEPN domain-containing protein